MANQRVHEVAAELGVDTKARTREAQGPRRVREGPSVLDHPARRAQAQGCARGGGRLCGAEAGPREGSAGRGPCPSPRRRSSQRRSSSMTRTRCLRCTFRRSPSDRPRRPPRRRPRPPDRRPRLRRPGRRPEPGGGGSAPGRSASRQQPVLLEPEPGHAAPRCPASWQQPLLLGPGHAASGRRRGHPAPAGPAPRPGLPARSARRRPRSSRRCRRRSSRRPRPSGRCRRSASRRCRRRHRNRLRRPSSCRRRPRGPGVAAAARPARSVAAAARRSPASRSARSAPSSRCARPRRSAASRSRAATATSSGCAAAPRSRTSRTRSSR